MDWLLHFLSWYVYLFIIGLVFLPFSARLFGTTSDKGYAFSKIIGIIALTYLSLLLGITRLVPFSKLQIVGILLVVGFFAYRKYLINPHKDFPVFILSHIKNIRIIIIEEVLFFGGLLLWVLVRGQEPSIRGLEKFMDFGFMQSIGRSSYFPPLDMWYSADIETRPGGYFINYYYFGHLSGALLIKLIGVPAAVGYNLVLANILGLALSAVFGIVVNLIDFTRRFVGHIGKTLSLLRLALYGVLGALLVNFAGNLHTIYLFTKGYENESPVPPWIVLPNIPELFALIGQRFPNFLGALGEYSRYWYPNATRFIPHTIHEFPSYSYVVADLHGHVFDIPFVLLSLAVVLFIFMPLVLARWVGMGDEQAPTGTHVQKHDKHIKHADTHDDRKSKLHQFIYAYFGQGFFGTLLVKCLDSHVPVTILFGFLTAVHFMTNAFDGPIYLLLGIGVLFVLHGLSIALVINLVILAFSFIYFSLPFSVFFEPFVSGVGVNCGFPLVEAWAKGAESLKVGPFLFEQGNCQRSPLYQMIILWGFFWFFALVLAVVMYLTRRLKDAAHHAEQKVLGHMMLFDKFMLLFFVFGTVLLIIPEFFYIKDIYPTHFRANTMFKMGYQAYIIMTIASVYSLWRLSTVPPIYKVVRRVLVVLSWILISLNLMYMNFAVQSYYGDLSKPIQLDGARWLKDQFADMHEIVEYFNTQVSGQPVILEAQGDSYTDYNVISAYTGLPTVAGWWVHQWLWRGSSDVVGVRIPHIEVIYRSEDVNLTRKLLRQYKVEYVIISSNERKKYAVDEWTINEEKFKTLGTEVFRTSDGESVVYKIR